MKLLSNEKELIGKWIYKNGELIKDKVTLRIEWLIDKYLIKVASDESGWISLYLDRVENNFWELSFPNSEVQGGGSPSLILISKEDALKRFKIEF